MKNSKGFSLIELIIVIAIMAILVGVMAPLLIHYIEKTNVSSDYQLADTVCTAITYSIVDAKVVEDPNSQTDLQNMDAGEVNINSLRVDSVLMDSIKEYTGLSNPSNVTNYVRSKHGTGCACMITTKNGQVRVTFTETDCTGKKDTTSGSTTNDIFVEH